MAKDKTTVGFLIFIIAALSLLVYQNLFLTRNLNKMTSQLDEVQVKFSKLTDEHTKVLLTLAQVKGAVTVLDSAVNSDTKRRARIAKIRILIREETAHINTPEIRELTAADIADMAVAVVDNSEKYDVPISLILGVIRQESAFNIKAISNAGALGLMQLLPSTAEDIKIATGQASYEPFRISHNIRAGTYYLSKMLHKFGFDQQKAVWAYNTGPEYVARFVAGEYENLQNQTIAYEQAVSKHVERFASYGLK